MRVLFHIGYPLAWAKGGHAIQILKTKEGLEKLGIDVGWVQDEDPGMARADIVHYWCRPPNDVHWQLARNSGARVVISELHQRAVLRPRWTWPLRGAMLRMLKPVLGGGFYGTLGVGIYPHGDAAIAVTPSEADYMRIVFGGRPDRVFHIPNGVDSVFFDTRVPPRRFDGLVYIAYICRRKCSLEVAMAAKRTGVPVLFIGGAAADEDDYFARFQREIDDKTVFWVGEIKDRTLIAAHLRGALGSFLASRDEAVGLSILESIVCNTPAMAPKLPNLAAYYGNAVEYCRLPGTSGFEEDLKAFHSKCLAGLKQTFPVLSWNDVARKIAGVYEQILRQNPHTLA